MQTTGKKGNQTLKDVLASNPPERKKDGQKVRGGKKHVLFTCDTWQWKGELTVKRDWNMEETLKYKRANRHTKDTTMTAYAKKMKSSWFGDGFPDAQIDFIQSVF